MPGSYITVYVRKASRHTTNAHWATVLTTIFFIFQFINFIRQQAANLLRFISRNFLGIMRQFDCAQFLAFLQHSGEIGKTLAEMSIEARALAITMKNIRQIVLCPHMAQQREQVMNNFNLHTPTRIRLVKAQSLVYANKFLTMLAYDYLRRRQREKNRRSRSSSGCLKGMDVLEFGGIEPNPAYES